MKQPIYNTALYLRLSRDDEQQGDSGSIQTQRMMLRDFAQTHGLNVVSEYVDDGWSGKNFERPAVQDLLQQARQGKIQCIIVKDDCVITELNAKSQIKCGFCAASSIFWPKTGKGKVQGGTRRVVCPPA